MSLYPALPADTGHSDGCAAANRGASGDGLRPAGADTPGSGVTAALCQCHDCFTAYRFACHSQGCLYFYFSRTHLCCLVHHFPPKHVLQLHVPQCFLCQPPVFAFALMAVYTELCLSLAIKSKFRKSDVLVLKCDGCGEKYAEYTTEQPSEVCMDPHPLLAATVHHSLIFFLLLC